MPDRNTLSGAVLLLTVAMPAFAQDVPSPPASEDALEDPMPRSRASSTQAAMRSTEPAGKKAVPQFALSINPAMLLLGGISAELDTAIAPHLSLFMAPSFIFGTPLLTSLLASTQGGSTQEVALSGFGIEGGLRVFTGGTAPKGFWLGPYAGAGMASATTTMRYGGDYDTKATAFQVGGMLGYSWISESHFYFSLGAGGGFQSTTTTMPIFPPITHTGPALALRLALGFAL